MSDLRLEDTIFAHLKKTFSSISDRMEDARRDLKGTDAAAVGETQLIEDVQDFADEWGYGIKQLGKHTQGAMESGFAYGFAGLVDGIDARLADELGEPTRFVATGGLAETIAPLCETIDEVDQLLTLRGLRLIWERNT